MKQEWQRAVSRGDAEIVRRLLDTPSPDTHLDTGSDEAVASDAVLGGSVALKESKALIDSKDRYGQTGLMIASKKGHTDVVRRLVERGAELNATAKFRLSAMMLAVINNHAEIVRILKDAGADLAIRGTGAPGFFDKTSLDLARERAGGSGDNEIVSMLEEGHPQS